ncbi:MAG: hypothetical protein HDS11_02605 [Bacteroides sp.]|nr:hypothetical protein [Bacteroides sp.]
MKLEISPKELARAVTNEIAGKYYLEFEQTWDLFQRSKIYEMIMKEDPKIEGLTILQLEDLWENERLFGQIMSTKEVKAGGLRNIEF